MKLQELVNDYGRVFETRKLRVNVNQNKIVRFRRVEGQVNGVVSLN